MIDWAGQHMFFVYAALAIGGLLFLESMSKVLRLLAVAFIAFIMYAMNNPCLPMPSWVLAMLP